MLVTPSYFDALILLHCNVMAASWLTSLPMHVAITDGNILYIERERHGLRECSLRRVSRDSALSWAPRMAIPHQRTAAR